MLTAEELDRLCVVMVGTRNPLNVGAAARAITNFGFSHLRVVHPYDVGFREARSAVNAEPVLTAAEEYESVSRAVADCSLVVGTTAGSQRHTEEPLKRLEAVGDEIRQHLRAGSNVALLFGSEKVGLSNQDLAHCDLLLRIPTEGRQLSMNLGQAVAICLYELIRQPATALGSPCLNPQLATAGQRERLISVLLQALSVSDYVHRGQDPAAEHRLRRLFGHLHLTRNDSLEWLGLLRHLLWKLQATHSPPSRDGE